MTTVRSGGKRLPIFRERPLPASLHETGKGQGWHRLFAGGEGGPSRQDTEVSDIFFFLLAGEASEPARGGGLITKETKDK